MSELNKALNGCHLAHPPARDRRAVCQTANADVSLRAILAGAPTWFIHAIAGMISKIWAERRTRSPERRVTGRCGLDDLETEPSTGMRDHG